MTPARRRLRTSRTLLRKKMMLVRPTLPTLRTLPSLRMMPARLTLPLSMPELMLKLLPETLKTRLLATELTMKSETENAIAELTARTDGQNQERIDDISDLRTKMMQENAYLKSLSGKTLGVYFNAYRSKAYDGGGEENLTFNGTYCNNGGGLDVDTGIFTCPTGGTYLFMFHIATHDNKKALLSIRKNGEEIASIFDQNHKDNHKNSMAGQNIIMDVKRGDEIVVYAYTGTWLADFPMNHYTHWVGLLLKPSQEEVEALRKAAEEV